MRYCFSGHESFYCKSLWLKKGYDYLLSEKSFSDIDSVAELGVGKNMVASIRFWLKAFALTVGDIPTELSKLIFDNGNGKDAFAEDINTLWLLHYQLVSSQIASIYNLLFLEFQREKIEFDRDNLHSFIKRKCSVPEQKNVYNENSVKKDIQVLLRNYVSPTDLKSIEDFSALLLPLGLIKQRGNDIFYFNETSEDEIDKSIILYSIIDRKGEDKTVSFDVILELSLLFCIPITKFISIIKQIETEYNGKIVYTDNSGIKNIHFLDEINKFDVLNKYYSKL